MFDGAALRRIYYKVLVDRPSRDEMIQIFMRTAKGMKVALEEDVLIYLMSQKYREVDNAYAAYHAPFLIDQMMSICDYEGLPRKMSVTLLDRAWENLFVAESVVEN
jgi:SpoVK/Ycf46/Vps4 family AAA+-type ATPase